MKTMQEEWKQYRDACYPGGLTDGTQNREVHQAFYAGALCAFQAYHALLNLTAAEASNKAIATKLNALEREIVETCKAIARPLPGGRN